MRKGIVALALAGASVTAFSETSSVPAPAATLIRRYELAAELCRGGSGDNPAALKACQMRDKAYIELKEAGWCWGPEDAINADKTWAKCADMRSSARTANNEAVRTPPSPTKTGPANLPEGASRSADDSSSWLPYCSVKSAAYKTAAQYRDQAIPPQVAWTKDLSLDAQWHYVGAEERKEIINKVYFDPAFSSLRGEALSQMVYSECMNQRRNTFKPLQ